MNATAAADLAPLVFSIDAEPVITTYTTGRRVYGSLILRLNGRIVWTGLTIDDCLAVRDRIVARHR